MHFTLWIGIVATLVFTLLVIIGVSVIQYNLFLKSLCVLKTTENEIAITFDDGPDETYTPLVLDVLARYNVKASFFCIGSKIKNNENILKRIHEEGHSIGNHSFEHASSFPFWLPKRMIESIEKTDHEIRRVIGKDVKLFRPPFGVVNNFIAYAVSKSHKKSVGWSIRTKDTVRTPEQVVEIVKQKIKPGSIILMHDSHENVVAELTQILDYCKTKNLQAVSIEDYC